MVATIDRPSVEGCGEGWQNVHAELVSLGARRAALDAEEARALRDAETMQIWKPFGYVSMLDYLERELGYAPKTGADRMRVARALADLPALTAALAKAELPYSAVRELVRVATSATEAAWLDAARGKNLRQLEDLVSGRRRGDLPDDPPDDQARLYTVRFEEVSAAAFAALRQARQILDEEHGTRMTDDEVVAALAAAILDGMNGGGADGARTDGRAKHQLAYTVCEVCDRMWQEASGAMIPVDAATSEQVRCDAQHIGSLDGDGPERATQDIPPATIRFVMRRDQGRCQTPGCRSARGLEIHHIVPRSRGGTHDPSNLTLRCGACHRAHHLGLITISGTAPDAITTTRRTIAPHHRPVTPREVPPPAPPLPPASADSDKASAAAQARRTRMNAVIVRSQAISALVTSGWPRAFAMRVVDEARAHVGVDAPLEVLLPEAFRCCLKRNERGSQ